MSLVEGSWCGFDFELEVYFLKLIESLKNAHKRGKFVDLEKGHENEKRALDQEKFVWPRS